jgi:hypothetical protein
MPLPKSFNDKTVKSDKSHITASIGRYKIRSTFTLTTIANVKGNKMKSNKASHP